jgi:hypothetical protein
MLSVILFCGGGPRVSNLRPETVVRTLAPLVQGSIKGLIGDVTLVGPPGHELALIGDHAGCAVIEAEAASDQLRLALEAARGPQLMLLHAGYVPEAGFFEEVEDLLAADLPKTGGVILRAAPETLLERFFPRLAPAAGMIVARSLCEAAAANSFANLIGSIRPTQSLRRHLRKIA